jgi:phage terminase small subunit
VVNGGNGVEAWRTAYPGRSWSGQAAAERASKLLAQDKVRARVDELAAIAKREAEEKFGVTVDWVICRLKLIADSNMCNYLSLDEKGGPSVTINDLDPERLFPLADFTVEDIESGRRVGKRSRVKLYNKVDALTKLGQYLGMFTERHEHVGKGGGPVQLVISSVEAQL